MCRIARRAISRRPLCFFVRDGDTVRLFPLTTSFPFHSASYLTVLLLCDMEMPCVCFPL